MRTSADEKKVLVAISGRVDSAVTAALLKTEGYHVSGLHLRFQVPEEVRQAIPLRCLGGVSRMEKDEQAAHEVCSKLGIPLYTLDVGELFMAEVLDPAVLDTLQLRRTSSCLACHQKIKLGMLLREADLRKHHWVATGHYAKISQGIGGSNEGGFSQLSRASDLSQDQSHLLFGLSQDTLSRLLMPLGGISKKMVLKLAKEFNLPGQSEDGDSGNGCVLRGKGFLDWVGSRSAASLRPVGIVRTARGEFLGEHQGLYQFSLGDRLAEGGLTPSHQEENNVIGFDRGTQTVILGIDDELLESNFIAHQASWVKRHDGFRGISCSARVGNRAELAPCRVTLFEADMIQIEFEKPLRAVAPGEVVCFYEGDEVLGGALIEGPVSTEPRGKKSK